MTHILDELRWRGLVAQSTDPDALRAALDTGPVTFYCGFDPTAPSLHIGNLVQISLVRRLQRAGHRPLVLVGGATGLIGAPKATSERQLNDPDVVAGWVARIRTQIEPHLDFDGPNAAVMVNNLDWTGSLSAIEFLRDVGKHFRVNRMLAKDAVASRLQSEAGLSFTEFSYQILQGLDFLQLHRRYGCVLQTGGSDQWGNLTSGTDLVRRVEGIHVHLLATPLITKSDGTKFGKTETGTVWLDAAMTSPYAFYQFWINVDDKDVVGYLRAFSFRPPEEIDALGRAVEERPAAREAQRALAEELTSLVHGKDECEQAVAASRALFGRGDLAALPEDVLAAALTEVGVVRLEGASRTIVHLLRDAGLCASLGEARRAVAEGGAYLNNRRVGDPEAVPSMDELLSGRWLVLRRGKRTVAGVEITR